jgi:hypothetical protein
LFETAGAKAVGIADFFKELNYYENLSVLVTWWLNYYEVNAIDKNNEDQINIRN